MGFGIRVPGVRISTRGVRVGPRMANVRVSYSGRVSASAGPRIARVSVSGSGVRVGAGVGPLGASVGRGGLRVGAGAGPLFGSVGRGGVRGGIGVGPLWVSSGGRARSHSAPRHKGGRIRMSDSYEAYREDLASSGGTRRNRDELRIAGINAAFHEALPVLAPLQTFEAPYISMPNQTDMNRWAYNWAKQVLVSQGRFKPSSIVVPLPPSKDELRKESLEELSRHGTHRPLHPLTQYGFSNEQMPSRSDVKTWAKKHVKTQKSLASRLFKSGQTKAEYEKLLEESLTKFEQQHAEWRKEVASFELTVTARLEQLRESHKENRINLQQRKDAEESDVLATAAIRRKEQRAVKKVLEETFKMYQQGDPTITTIVLQAAFSDNEGSAAPVGIDQNDLLVVMTAPPLSDVIWPEIFNPGQYISAKKKNKGDRESDYEIFLICHTLATAKEAFVVASKIQRIKILVLDEKDGDTDPFNRPLLAVLQVDRQKVEKLPKGFEKIPAIAEGYEYITKWHEVNQSGNPYAIVEWAQWFEASGFHAYINFHRAGLEILLPYDEFFNSWNNVPRSKRPKFIDFTESTTNTSDDIQVSDDISAEDLKVLDLSVEEMNTLDFWMLCALLAENWDADQVDLAGLKLRASTLVTCLYQFEEADIDWSIRESITYPVVT